MAQNERNDMSKLLSDPGTLANLAKSADAQALASILTQGHDRQQLEQMAQSAMSGDMQSLKSLMKSITDSPEGSELLRRLSEGFHKN